MNEIFYKLAHELLEKQAHRWIASVGIILPFTASRLRTSRHLEERDIVLVFLLYAACRGARMPTGRKLFAGTPLAPHILRTGFPEGFWEQLRLLRIDVALRSLPIYSYVPAPRVEDIVRECRQRYTLRAETRQATTWMRPRATHGREVRRHYEQRRRANAEMHFQLH